MNKRLIFVFALSAIFGVGSLVIIDTAVKEQQRAEWADYSRWCKQHDGMPKRYGRHMKCDFAPSTRP